MKYNYSKYNNILLLYKYDFISDNINVCENEIKTKKHTLYDKCVIFYNRNEQLRVGDIYIEHTIWYNDYSCYHCNCKNIGECLQKLK